MWREYWTRATSGNVSGSGWLLGWSLAELRWWRKVAKTCANILWHCCYCYCHCGDTKTVLRTPHRGHLLLLESCWIECKKNYEIILFSSFPFHFASLLPTLNVLYFFVNFFFPEWWMSLLILCCVHSFGDYYYFCCCPIYIRGTMKILRIVAAPPSHHLQRVLLLRSRWTQIGLDTND